MEHFGIERSVVANINGVFYKNTQPANEELAAAIKPFSDKFIPVCGNQSGLPGLGKTTSKFATSTWA